MQHRNPPSQPNPYGRHSARVHPEAEPPTASWKVWFRDLITKFKLPQLVLWNEISGKLYLVRTYLFPNNHRGNIYIHDYTGPDDTRYGLHNHSSPFLSIRLKGRYFKEFYQESADAPVKERFLPRITFRTHEDIHAISDGDWPVRTLIFRGPTRQVWGFFTPRGWKEYTEVGPEDLWPEDRMDGVMRAIRR